MPRNHRHSSQEEYRLGIPMDQAFAYLTMQDRALLELMGGIFPERAHDVYGVTRVLDIACGTGNWAVRVAYENPQIEVIGIEYHRQLVDYASGLAEAQHIENTRFVLLSGERSRFPFPDQHFDLVRAHFLFNWLTVETWPAFIQECFRLTHPGGSLCLIEPEWAITTSPALERFSWLFLRALKQAGHTLSPDGRHLGIVSQLPFFLRHVGATDIICRAYAMENFLGVPMARDPATQVEHLAQLLTPLILSQGIATAEEVAQMLREATLEMGREDFCPMTFVLSACGCKPAI